MHDDAPAIPPLTPNGRLVILVCAFLGWFCCGFHMSITSLAMRPAAIDLLSRTGQLDRPRYLELGKQQTAKTLSEADKPQLDEWNGKVTGWFSWLTCAFLFGAATGGLLFGRLGDLIGRSKAMAFSILTYSTMAGAARFSQAPEHLLVLWFLACTGVGGMWPNGVALLSEAWASLSRPMVAGLIGTSANIGIFLMSYVASTSLFKITPDTWRTFFWFGTAPVLLGLISLAFVPESPRWLASRLAQSTGAAAPMAMSEIFRGKLLGTTLIGILLATVPIVGGWGSANWMVPWADTWADSVGKPEFKAHVQMARSLTGLIGSLLGGWVGSLAGRRMSYFLISIACLFCAQYTFWFVQPKDGQFFLACVAALGFFSGIYFGWLPLFLPELFPTRVRSTGAGVSFNFGRILTAVTVFATGALKSYFNNDFARIGQVTSLIFAVGMVAILLAPDTSQKQLQD